MKKGLFILVSFIVFLSFFTPPKAASAQTDSFCAQYKGVKKIMWKGMELKSGQIGLLTVVKNTPLYQLKGEEKVIARTLKPKEVYRIYAFLPGKLGVGGGYYIDRDSRIKYESPSKTSLNAVQCIHKIDLSTSIISTVKQTNSKGGVNWYNLVYDSDSENFVRISEQSGSNMVNNAFTYTLSYDPSSSDRNGNYHVLYRVDLSNPSLQKKIIGNISYARVDGKYLYYSINAADGSSKIYKSVLDGNEQPQLLKELTYSRYNYDFYVENGFIYLHNGLAHQFERFSTDGGEIEVVNNYSKTFGASFISTFDTSYSAMYSGSQTYFGLYQVIDNQINADKDRSQIIFDPQSNKLFKFYGPTCDETIMVYKNILYYPKHYYRNELFSVDSQGKAKSVLKVKGTIIGFSENYVLYYDEVKDTVNKVKVAN